MGAQQIAQQLLKDEALCIGLKLQMTQALEQRAMGELAMWLLLLNDVCVASEVVVVGLNVGWVWRS